MLCTWAREHKIIGTGVDINPPFVAAAREPAEELGVAANISILHGDAAGWRADPPDQETVDGCHAPSRDAFGSLPELIELFADLDLDVVEMVLADEHSWDRYAAAQWLNIRRFLDANPDDELADELRDELREAPLRHVRYLRPWLGWGVFALMPRTYTNDRVGPVPQRDSITDACR